MSRPSACLRGSVYTLVTLAAMLFVTSMVLMGLRLHGALSLKWWLVLLPAGLALGCGFLVLTIAVLMWLKMTLMLLTGAPLRIPEGSGEVSLDVIFTTAKTCLLGHGAMTMVFLSFVLLEVKLRWYEQTPQKVLPALYPLLPLVVLGALHFIVSFIFKRPEVDSGWSLVASLTLLSQSIFLILKLDYYYSLQHFFWALAFLPSWLAYMCVFVFAVNFGVSSVVSLAQARVAESRSGRSCPPWQASDGGSGGTAGEDGKPASPRSEFSAASPTGKSGAAPWPEEPARHSSQIVLALVLWSFGTCASQVMLALRLDDIARMPWLFVIAPACLMWTLLVICAVAPLSSYVLEMRQRLLQPVAESPVLSSGSDERAPLLPWRNNY